MIDADEISPFGHWDDARIVAWARSRGLHRLPVAKVPLCTTDAKAPDTAVIHFQDGARVDRILARKPLPTQL